MYRTFIATVAAASIALTALGTAVQAGDRGNSQAIAAILGLAAVGAIIHQHNKRDEARGRVRHQPAPVYVAPKPVYNPPAYNPPRYNVPKPRPLPNRVNRKLLPQECFRSFETRRGKVRMFGARCLNRNYDFAHRLPHECQYLFNTHRGERRGYEARCLRDRGYRLARG